MGKTSLIERVVRESHSRVLRALGSELEEDLPFAALHQWLGPVLDHAVGLAPVQRRALHVALGGTVGEAPDPLVLGSAVLALLSRLGPVLLVLDDAQWLDEGSGRLLAFLARRISGTRISILIASSGDVFTWGLPVLELRPLDTAESALLLAAQPNPPTGRRRVDILEQAAGNPLALVELARAEACTSLGPLPLSDRMEQLFAAELADLPEDVRHTMLLAATDSAAADVRFRHPLMRSAIYHMATAQQRREAHLLCAEAVPERRVWHLAAASTRPDEAVARELEIVAEHAHACGAFAAAVTALQRAAQLSEDGTARFVEAARIAVFAGYASWGEELLADVHTTDPELRAVADLCRGQAFAETRQQSALAPLIRAAEHLPAHLKPDAWESAAAVAYSTGERLSVPAVLGADVAPPWIRLMSDPSSASVPDVRDLEALSTSDEPGNLTTAATMAWLLDETATAVELFERAADSGERPKGLRCAAAWAYLDSGQWAKAKGVAEDAAHIAAQAGLSYLTAEGMAFDATLLALQGHSEAAEERATAALALVPPHSRAAITVRSRWALGLAAMGAGDHASAFDQLRMLFTPSGEPEHYHVSRLAVADLAVAAVRTGHSEVIALVDGLRPTTGRQRAVLHHARALLCDSQKAEAHFEAALDATPWPFQLARTRLDYACWLRRQLRHRLARPLLVAALDTFRRLGAGPWADRCVVELRAAGVRTTSATPAVLLSLTPQQQHIVRLTAEGLTNREIGERLFLSPRTVSSHLYRSFPKLGVTSRSQLRDLFDAAPTPPVATPDASAPPSPS
jgi:DNA-binding CsgD family transcriptional regulator